MPAILVNIYINSEKKFEIFKVTISEVITEFSECHIKIRGAYSSECIKFLDANFNKEILYYQDLPGQDWAYDTRKMLKYVTSRSVFLYFEDHKLVGSKEYFKGILNDFDELLLDYLSYSFFKASKLSIKNILPYQIKSNERLSTFDINFAISNGLGKISPYYYLFSLPSIISVRYLNLLLKNENVRLKISCNILSRVIKRLMPYPQYRNCISKINYFLYPLRIRYFLTGIDSPHDVEKLWSERLNYQLENCTYGLPSTELFANYDDDNGGIGESLIKRGLYPFDFSRADLDIANFNTAPLRRIIEMKAGEIQSGEYISANDRISDPPIVQIKIKNGRISLDSHSFSRKLNIGTSFSYYSNQKISITAEMDTILELFIYDECLI
jgi:hypothetical protein